MMYQTPRGQRFENRTVAGTARGGKLVPAMAVAVRESESGALAVNISAKLDSPAGTMLTPAYLGAYAVAVPINAAHAMKNDTHAYPGSDEVIRQELISGNVLFDLENEGEVSKRLGINPRSIGGVKKVNEIARIAHNCAVNHLRRKKNVNAVQLGKNDDYVTPALIGQTVLDRLNGVLDPEDRVNGAVNLQGQLKIKSPRVMYDATSYMGGLNTSDGASYVSSQDNLAPAQPRGEWPTWDGTNWVFDQVFADLNGASGLALSAFYQAQRMDSLTRKMREVVDDNPEHGEEIVARMARGLSVEGNREPFVVYENEKVMNMGLKGAMDGANLDQVQTNIDGNISFTVPIPKMEFGCVIVVFLAVKPDEVLASQPHPVLSDVWAARNYLVDEMAVDPVAVTIRDLNSDCAQVDESTVALYVGNNHLLKNYVHYGFNRATDLNAVAAKTAIWQLEVPMSVTPESVIYPADISHYPFPDQLADVVQYNVSARARIDTPIIFGPAPVEELAAIETENVFEDQ